MRRIYRMNNGGAPSVFHGACGRSALVGALCGQGVGFGAFALRFAVACLGVLSLGLSGCFNYYPIIFVDETAKVPPITTPSAARARELAGTHQSLSREYPPAKAPSVSGAVEHGPLYFEDPFETHGSRDGVFAWTWEDYFAFFYCDARWLINGIATPVSVVVDPPPKPMETGGEGFRHATFFHVHEGDALDRPAD